MGEIEKKRFKEPSAYYWRFALYSLMVVLGVFLISDFVFLKTDEELYNMFADQELIGSSKQRSAQLIESFLVQHFGKVGLIIVLSLILAGGAYEFYKTIAEYRRYKKKCRLYHEGVIKNFHDIYDDYVPLLSWRRIKTLFSKKEKTYKKKYPSKRKMRKQIKELQKQCEQIEN